MGEVLARGGTVRVRPLDGGGNETQVEAPAGGRFYVKGLESGDYEAVDERGHRRVFTVTDGPGEEVTLELFPEADAGPGVELPPNHGTEAELVADESHEIQHGIKPMTVKEGTAVLQREGSEVASDLNPPTIPGPGQEVTEETVGNSSDADAPREPVVPEALVTGDPAAHAAGSVPGVEGGEPVGDDAPAPGPLSAADLADAVRGDRDDVSPTAARDELVRRAGDGDDESAKELALLAGSDVPPADDPEHDGQ